jgi:hypothetical protein
VLKAAHNWKEWVAESADDYIEIYEAFIGLAKSNDPRTNHLRSDVERLKSIKIQHGLPDVRKADRRLAWYPSMILSLSFSASSCCHTLCGFR